MFTATKDDATAKAHRAAQDIKHGTTRIQHDMRNTAEDLKDDLNDLAHDVARKAGHHVRDFADSASENISAATETVTTKITDKPLQAVALAAGVGFVLGMLFRR